MSYDARGNTPLRSFFHRDTDLRLPAMERVVAVELGDGWAVAFETWRRVRVVNQAREGVPFVVFWEEGAASALDTEAIARGRDVDRGRRSPAR